MRYHNITKDDMLNGDGIRVVLWVAGCSHHCKNCQNPETWDPKGGLKVTADVLNELYEELDKDYVSGLTFSGGDPMHYANLFDERSIIASVRNRFPGKSIWLYTGYTWEQLTEGKLIPEAGNAEMLKKLRKEIAESVDVLVDGEYIEDLRDVSLPWRGSRNQRVIDVKKTLAAGRIILFSL